MRRWKEVDCEGFVISSEINSELYGKFVWIETSNVKEKCFDIVVIPNNDAIILKTCSSLNAAKRWVSMNII